MSALSSIGSTFDEDLELWDDLGVGSVALFLDKLEAAGLDAAVGHVAAAGLAVSSIACRGFTLHQPGEWPPRRAALEAAVDAAAAVHAECLFVTAGAPGPLGWDECVAALHTALAPLRDRAAAQGVRVAVEHTNPMRRDVGFIHSLRDMVEVARQLDIGVVVEITNCWSDRGLEETIAHGADTFSVVQLSDYLVGTVCATERAVPGDGDIPLAHLVRTIEAAGYRGMYELEMLGPRIEDEGYGVAIRRAIGALDQILPSP